MDSRDAHEIIDNNTERLLKLDPIFKELFKEVYIELDDGQYGGDTHPQYGSISVSHGLLKLSKQTNVPEKILLSNIFYHEVGHQVKQWLMMVEPEKRVELMKEYLSTESQYRDFPEYFLKSQGYDNFKNPALNSLYDLHYLQLDFNKQDKLFEITSKLEGIYHEQFADCFSLFMIKKQFPSQFDNFVKFIINQRIEDENKYGDNLSFFHSTSKSLINFTEVLKNEQIPNLDTFLQFALPIIDKNCVLEIQSVMKKNNMGDLCPKEFNDLATSLELTPLNNETNNIKNKILAIRKSSMSNDNENIISSVSKKTI